jgi:chemotaxis response regulator CheB
MRDPYKLLIVDDSKMMRRAIYDIFAEDDRIQVVGDVADGAQALEIIPQINPDVITMDVNMPVMDGLTTLKHMMIECPCPTVMLSTLTLEGASTTFDALKYGAVDFVPKPSKLDDSKLEGQEEKRAGRMQSFDCHGSGRGRLRRTFENRAPPFPRSSGGLPRRALCRFTARGRFCPLSKRAQFR